MLTQAFWLPGRSHGQVRSSEKSTAKAPAFRDFKGQGMGPQCRAALQFWKTHAGPKKGEQPHDPMAPRGRACERRGGTPCWVGMGGLGETALHLCRQIPGML